MAARSATRRLASASLCSRCSLELASWRRALPPSPYRHATTRSQSAWAAATQAASSFVRAATRTDPPLPAGMKIDPFRSVAKELKFLSHNIRGIIGSGHPVLDTVSKYYAQAEGKHIRPLLVLLMSQATALMPSPHARPQPLLPREAQLNEGITPADILADWNPSASALSTLDPNDDNTSVIDRVLPSQRRLAEITELIHTASLLHDDVIDNATTRRGQPAANLAFGNKMAVLAGDFLLGRASVALARLRDAEVTELLATVIANLIEGEFMQLRNTPSHDSAAAARVVASDQATLDYYLHKTYLKSASLISKSCRAAALLGQCDRAVADAAYAYGKNLGLAFQLVDDMLDFTARDDAQLGKPAGADLELGLATAPLLFAWRERPELGALVERRFEGEGDAAKAREIVLQTTGIEQTRALAQSFVDAAAAAIAAFPESDAKTGLLDMCSKVMSRQK